MCGILFHVSPHSKEYPEWWNSLVATNKARGPDAFGQQEVQLENKRISVNSSVLALKGDKVAQQPIKSQDGQLQLLWNGEVFDSLSDMDPMSNDGLQIMSSIERHILNGKGEKSIEDTLVKVMSAIEGPYAMVLFDSLSSSVYYGRDPLGRRSLLQGSATGTDLLICSAASTEAIQSGVSFSELDCSSFWKVDLADPAYERKAIPRAITQYTKPFKLRELQKEPVSEREDCEEATMPFLSTLSDCVRRRVCHIRQHGYSKDAQVAILFSGGLDCCTLALLAHMYIDSAQPIDLLNVAFENPRVLQARSKKDSNDPNATKSLDTFDVPDRKTGRQSYEELKSLAPTRQWNLVEVNVRHEEYLAERSNVESLMEPCASVMDLSIASALYFACRGRGDDGYTSSAKVLLSGLGADELLGGYSRHRKAFATNGKQGLVEELQMDLDRLATRNLGRDDRILSSSGKEARYPYLSHSIISYLANLPVEKKMDFESLPAGQGDKKLLRDVAKHLGLLQTSALVKRAIQFGARSAKMEVGAGKILGHEKLKS